MMNHYLQRYHLRTQAFRLFRLLIECEFNLRARGQELTRRERLRLNRITTIRERAKRRAQRRLAS